VVEPGQRSVQTAHTVKELARGLGVKKVYVVANKIRNESDVAFLKEHIGDMELVGVLKFNQSVMDADVSGLSPFAKADELVAAVRDIKTRLDRSLG
jgi:CO dehydrogenase maturation factor